MMQMYKKNPIIKTKKEKFFKKSFIFEEILLFLVMIAHFWA